MGGGGEIEVSGRRLQGVKNEAGGEEERQVVGFRMARGEARGRWRRAVRFFLIN